MTSMLILTMPHHVAAQSSRPAASQPSGKLASPEAAVHEFLLAMVNVDRERINACTIDVPGREVLLQGGDDRPPPEMMKEIEDNLRNIPLKRLKVGDRVALPGGKSLLLTADMVNENEQRITGPDFPFPFIVIKVGTQWRVNPAPIIAARRAAAPPSTTPSSAPATRPVR